MEIEESLKEIRVMRGLSQRQFCENILSPSYYSKVEKGDGNLTMNSLVEILQTHQVPLLQYFFQFYPQDFKQIIETEDEILQAFITKNLTKLNEIQENFSSSKNLIVMIVQDEIAVLKKKKQVNTYRVKKGLFNLENYNEHFLWFVLMALLVYSKENFEGIVTNIFKKYAPKKHTAREGELLADIAIIYLKRPCNKNKKLALQFLKELAISQDIFLLKVMEKYFTAKLNGETEQVREIKELIIDLKIKSFLGLEDILN